MYRGEKFLGSRLFVYYNERVLDNNLNEDAGSYLSTGIRTFEKYGVCPEYLWPYDTANWRTKPNEYCYRARGRLGENLPREPMAMRARTPHCTMLDGTVEAILKAINDGKPVVFSMLVFDSFLSIGRDGRVPMPAPGDFAKSGHAMLVVGYNLNERLLIVRNSWGTGFGDAGHCYLPFDYIQRYGSDMWTVDSIDRVCGRAQCILSDEGGGVTLFTDCDFRGRSQRLTEGKYRMVLLGIANDSLSSLRVEADMAVDLYEHDYWNGAKKTLGPGEYPCLMFERDASGGNWNDRVSSISVRRLTYSTGTPSYPMNDVKPVGCFLDHAGRTMEWAPGQPELTYEGCRALAAAQGKPYFALQNGHGGIGQCFLSDDLGQAQSKGPSEACREVDGAGRNLGGPWANYVYERGHR